MRRELEDAVGGDGVAIEVRGEFGGSLLGGEVDIRDAEAFAVAVSPLEVVKEGPEEVALDGDAFRDGALELGEVVAKEHDAVGVVDVAIGGDLVGGGAAVFRDVDLLDVPDVVRRAWGPSRGLPGRW